MDVRVKKNLLEKKAGCCENGNELSGCAHCEKFLEELRIYCVPQIDFTLALV